MSEFSGNLSDPAAYLCVVKRRIYLDSVRLHAHRTHILDNHLIGSEISTTCLQLLNSGSGYPASTVPGGPSPRQRSRLKPTQRHAVAHQLPPSPAAHPSSGRYQDQHTLSPPWPKAPPEGPGRLSCGRHTGTTSRETRESATTALSSSYGQNKTRLEIESSMCDCQTLAPCKMFPWHGINYCHRC